MRKKRVSDGVIPTSVHLPAGLLVEFCPLAHGLVQQVRVAVQALKGERAHLPAPVLVCQFRF